MGLFKNIPIHGEQMHLQFRAEAFNTFNHSQLYVTVPTTTGNSLQRVVMPAPTIQRVIQAALRAALS
jgi:hypothetical protein